MKNSPMQTVSQAPSLALPAATLRRHRSMPLDSIRTVAILAVLIYHVATRYKYADLDPLALMFRKYGLLGVDVFFPLSGYLITRILLHHRGRADIKVFFQRRFFRIVPLYLAAVTTFLILSVTFGFDREIIDRIWIAYLFLTGWMIFFDGTETVPYTITWSLSVEEFAYILFGLVAWLYRRSFTAFLYATAAAAITLRITLNLAGFEALYNFPPARLDSIAIGGIVAILMVRKVRGVIPALAVLSLLTYLTAIYVPELWSSLKYTFIAFGTCFAIVLFETNFRDAGGRFLSWFSAIGFYSYFIYLFHLFNIELVLKLSDKIFLGMTPPFWGVVIAALALTQAQAMISFRFFEGPLIKYGRRLETGHSGLAANAAAQLENTESPRP